MFRVSISQSIVLRHFRAGLAISIMSLAAACSSSTTRFGPFDGTKTTSDPGYNQTQHTGSLSDNQSDTSSFNRDVASQPLDGTPDPAPRTVSAPGSNVVIVNKGDTLYSISRQTGASVTDLIAVNNLQQPYGIKVGQRIEIPSANNQTRVAANPSPTISPAAVQIVQTKVPGTHKVLHGQTLYSISRAYGHRPDTVASHNRINAPYLVKVGQKLHIPATGAVVASNNTQAARPSTIKQSPVKPAMKLAPVPTAKTVQKPVTTTKAPVKNPAVPQMTSSKFRWPVKGRVISKFGTQTSGVRNDGINIAVPEGTSVKAAENGVIAYAGNELKGYGNLILVRHANNWVTAYAHNKELFVRRGDTVKRGQIIAKAGKSGSVTSPQLHFEIRKGAQAVDPRKYLSSNTVAGG